MITACLQAEYGLRIIQAFFLPIGADRQQSLQYLKSNFLPGGTLEIACLSDRVLRLG